MSAPRSPQRLCRKDGIRKADASLQPYQKSRLPKGDLLFCIYDSVQGTATKINAAKDADQHDPPPQYLRTNQKNNAHRDQPHSNHGNQAKSYFDQFIQKFVHIHRPFPAEIINSSHKVQSMFFPLLQTADSFDTVCRFIHFRFNYTQRHASS